MLETVQSSESRTYGNTNWIDQLTSINGTDITYDNMGNPFKWHNASSLTWEGRKLKTFTKTDGTVISYTYDENGIRTGKKIGSESVEYVLSGSNIIQEKRANYTLTFLYDGDTLVGFNYKAGTTNADYYYGIDNFGNINYIYDANGNIVVTYRYDAWGNAISTTGSLASTIGTINPYRYKSYYFDSEINMYYLQSRYYDASVQRFVSADDVAYLGASGGIYSYNLYSYCENDSINNYDYRGTFLFTLFRTVTSVKSIFNYFNNGNNDYECTGKLIMGQDLLPDVYYGLSKMSVVGCEIIATYNAMVLLGKKPSLRSIIYEFENNGSMFLYGTMGSFPSRINRYFDNHDITYIKYTSVDELKDSVKYFGIYVISFWTKTPLFSSIHTVAVYYTGYEFLVYNRYNNSTSVMSYKSIESIFSDGRFIVAYKILGPFIMM